MKTDSYANEDATQELLRISKWPEPLRLAYLLEKEMQWPLHGKAADELRRLHALNQELLAALKYHQEQTRPIHQTIEAIAKAEGGAT